MREKVEKRREKVRRGEVAWVYLLFVVERDEI